MKIENRSVIVVNEDEAVELKRMIVWLEEAVSAAKSRASYCQHKTIQDAYDAFMKMITECVVGGTV